MCAFLSRQNGAMIESLHTLPPFTMLPNSRGKHSDEVRTIAEIFVAS